MRNLHQIAQKSTEVSNLQHQIAAATNALLKAETYEQAKSAGESLYEARKKILPFCGGRNERQDS